MPEHTRIAARAIFLSSATAVIITATVAVSVASSSSGQDKAGQVNPGMAAGNTAADTKFDGDKDKIVAVTIIPSGYRDWKFVSAAHEAGELNDIRVVIGNDKAINAYRAGKPFPEGAIIGRVAWKMVPSEENNKTFGQPQSFVPGEAPDWYLQFMEKNTKKYAATGGWGYSNFDKGLKPTTDQKTIYSCFVCHKAVTSRDYVFTKYAP